MSTIVERVADLQYRLLDGFRSPRAGEVAARGTTVQGFDALHGSRQCVVVTYKRAGEAVPTPVNFGLSDDGLLYFRAEPRSAKVRRIRNNPRVRVAASNIRGRPKGPVAEGIARIVPATEAERAERAVAANWTPGMRVVERGLDRLPIEMAYVEVRPA